MKKLAFFFLCLLSTVPAEAQLTTVSGTVTDTNGLPYGGGQIKMQIVTTAGNPVSGQPTMTVNNQAQCVSGGFGSAPCQVPFQGTVGPLALSPSGTFTINLQDNTLVTPASTQWLFTANTTGVPIPGGSGAQVCISQLTVSGASQTVTLSSCPILTQVTESALSAKNFQVVADCLRVYDASWSNGANPVVVTSASANFNAARDNGKNCFGNDSNSGLNTAPLGLLTVVNPTTANCSGTATATSAGSFFAWGTIDDAAWTRVRAAAAASQSPTCIIGPNGASLITRSPLIDPRTAPIPWSWCFAGPVGGLTTFVPTPTFDSTTCTGPSFSACIWEANQGPVIQNTVPQYAKLDNVAVDGMNFRCTAGFVSKAAFGLTHVEGHNIWAWNWCGTAAGIGTFSGITLSAPNSIFNLNANNTGGSGINVQSAATPTQTFLASSYAGAQADGTDITIAGPNAIVVSKGNFWQACQTQCVIVGAGSTMVMDGDTGTGTSGNQFVDVTGTLIVQGGTALIPSNPGGSTILTRATGKVFVRDAIIKETGAGGVAFNVNTVPGGSIINNGNVQTVGTDQTLLATSNVVLSAGWGATATVSNPTGTPDSNPTRFSFQVNSAGAGQAANPTMAITYPAPVPTTPSWTCKQAGGTGAISQVSGENGATTTAVTLTWNGTPAAGLNYVIICTGSLL